MSIKRTATSVWSGSGPKGTGNISTLSGAMKEQPFAADFRFASEDGRAGTNPEELIAAAHSSCFTMALAFRISGAGSEAKELSTVATVSMAKLDSGWTVTGIHLEVTGNVPGMDAAKFTELAEDAKQNCPISKALSATPITLAAKLA